MCLKEYLFLADNLLAQENLKYKSDVKCQRTNRVGVKALRSVI